MIYTEFASKITRADTQLRLAELYEGTFPAVAKFVSKRGGSFEDAKDIFHDSLVIFCEKLAEEKLPLGVVEQRYLLGIAKHLWFRKAGEDNRKRRLDDLEETISIPEDYFDTSDNRLLSLLELTGRKCLELLRAFYYDNLGIREIANAFGFSSAHSASVQKFKCIGKMRETIQKKSLTYEDLA